MLFVRHLLLLERLQMRECVLQLSLLQQHPGLAIAPHLTAAAVQALGSGVPALQPGAEITCSGEAGIK